MSASNGTPDPTPISAPPALSAHSLDWSLVRRMLPHRGAMALLDGVESYEPDHGRVVGFKQVAGNDSTVASSDPGDPALPPPLVIEALAQACGMLMNLEHLRARGIGIEHLRDPDAFARVEPPPLSVLAESRIVHHGLARPGDTVRLEVRFALRRKDLCSFRVEARVGSRLLAGGSMVLAYPPYTARLARGPVT